MAGTRRRRRAEPVLSCTGQALMPARAALLVAPLGPGDVLSVPHSPSPLPLSRPASAVCHRHHRHALTCPFRGPTGEPAACGGHVRCGTCAPDSGHRRSERGGAATAAVTRAESTPPVSCSGFRTSDVRTRFLWTEQPCTAPPAPTPPWGGRPPGTCAGACVLGAVLREHPPHPAPSLLR